MKIVSPAQIYKVLLVGWGHEPLTRECLLLVSLRELLFFIELPSIVGAILFGMNIDWNTEEIYVVGVV